MLGALLTMVAPIIPDAQQQQRLCKEVHINLLSLWTEPDGPSLAEGSSEGKAIGEPRGSDCVFRCAGGLPQF